MTERNLVERFSVARFLKWPFWSFVFVLFLGAEIIFCAVPERWNLWGTLFLGVSFLTNLWILSWWVRVREAPDEGDFYNGMVVYFSQGDSGGQARIVKSYDGTTRTATVEGPFFPIMRRIRCQ